MSIDEVDEGRPGGGGGADPQAAFSPLAMVVPTLLRFHLLILLAIGLGVGAGLFRAVTLPNQYRSVGKLMVRSGIRENLTVDAAISSDVASDGGRMISGRDAVMNELQVLSAPAMAEKVVKRLGAESLVAPYDPTWGSDQDASWAMRLFHGFQAWWFDSNAEIKYVGVTKEAVAMQLLDQTLQILPEMGTTVIHVVHHSDSPVKAKRVVDAALLAARELHAEVFSASVPLASVEAELALAAAEARDAEARLREYCVEREIYNYEAQQTALVANLERLSQSCDDASLDIQRRQAERATLARILDTVPEKRPIDGQLAINPEYTRLTALIGQLEIERLNLELAVARTGASTTTPAQLKVVTDLLEQTVTLREKEASTIQPLVVDHPRRERIVQLLDETDVALDGLQKQVAYLGLARTAMRERLTTFEAFLPGLRMLELDAREKRDYSDGFARYVANLRTVHRLDQNNLSNLLIMHDGTFEPTKTEPKRSKLLLLGGMGGGMVGLLLAMWLTYRERRVLGDFDLFRSGVPAQLVARSNEIGEGWPFAEGRQDIEQLWTMVPYDRRDQLGIQIAVLPASRNADAVRVAADLAIGLARHGDEKVLLVSCANGPTSFETAGKLASMPGWRDVVAKEVSAAAAVQSTAVPGLSYLAAGEPLEGQTHATGRRSFLELLDRLRSDYRFVVVQLHSLDVEPESRGILRIAEAAMLVISPRETMRAQVREAVAAIHASGAQMLAGLMQSDNRA